MVMNKVIKEVYYNLCFYERHTITATIGNHKIKKFDPKFDIFKRIGELRNDPNITYNGLNNEK